MAEDTVYVGWSSTVLDATDGPTSIGPRWVAMSLDTDATRDLKALFYGDVKRVDQAAFVRYERALAEYREAERVVDEAPRLLPEELMSILRSALVPSP